MLFRSRADDAMRYRMTFNGAAPSYESPLLMGQSRYNFLRKGQDTVNYRIYRLPKAMMPGDTALMNIHSVTAYRGFVNNGFRRDIVYDGTFFSEGLPSFGYNASEELTSDEQRKKFHLTPLNEELPPQTDSIGKRTLLFNDDADLIQYEATLSTKESQIAIAPGYLVRQWKQNGRSYFQYVQDSKIQFFLTMVSGRDRKSTRLNSSH